MHIYPVIRNSYSNEHCRYRIKIEFNFVIPFTNLQTKKDHLIFLGLVNKFNDYSNYKVLL